MDYTSCSFTCRDLKNSFQKVTNFHRIAEKSIRDETGRAVAAASCLDEEFSGLNKKVN